MSEKRVFLLGAGFSIAVSDYGNVPRGSKMPSLKGLSEAVIKELKENNRFSHHIPTSSEEDARVEIDKLVSIASELPDHHREQISRTYNAITDLNREAYLPGVGTPIVKNFEQWLSYLIEAPPWLSAADQLRNRAAFQEITQAVHFVLNERQLVTVATQGKCPDWLSSLVRHWDSQSSSVITFNYDQFVELAWLVNVEPTARRTQSWDLYPTPLTPLSARAGATPPVNCDADKFQLYKLHGSIGWWYSGPDSPPSDVIYDQGLGGDFSQDHLLRRGGWRAHGLDGCGHTSQPIVEDRQPMIVPPAAVKSSYYNNTTLKAMWKSAARALNHATELVIMGFSLPATDLLVGSMLCTNVSKDCRIVPVDYRGEIIERVRETFDLTIDSPRLDTNYACKGADAIPHWVRKNTQDG